MTGAFDPEGGFELLGGSPWMCKMPFPAPTEPHHHAANVRAVMKAVNSIPLSRTQTVAWSFTDLPGDGTPRVVGKLLFQAGTHRLHQIGSFISSASDVVDAQSILDPVPSIIALAGDGSFGFLQVAGFPDHASGDLTGIVSFPETTIVTVSISATAATTTDTFTTQGALILDPVNPANIGQTA